MYNYFYVKTDCLSNTWDTAEIMRFLRQYNIFTEKSQGDFFSQTPFISVSLMRLGKIQFRGQGQRIFGCRSRQK